MFLATHSADVIRGVLDANASNVRIVRLRRRGSVNITTQLSSEDVRTFWSDPLLRHSNLLDGLFHERVVVCEGDADCRFYSALVDVIEDQHKDKGKSDLMFVHSGGKDRMPLVVRALKRVGVPVCIIADFDILRDETPFRTIIEAIGGNWTDYELDWRNTKSAIEMKRADLASAEAKAEIISILESVDELTFPAKAADRIRDILRQTSFWSIVKEAGLSAVPAGEPTSAARRLIESSARLGLFIVPCGELESFARSTKLHGPAWVNSSLTKDLANDEELGPAREFVARVLLHQDPHVDTEAGQATSKIAGSPG